jgi:nucleoside-diphosphate-sugar epimerase
MSDIKVLITGANGFVGTNLFDALSGDFHLVGIDINGAGKYAMEDFYPWDALEKIPPVHTIIHLAGKAHDTANTSREEEYFEVNVGLTKKIFEYFLQSKAEKFIYFSSVKAVADTLEGMWLKEEDVPDPKTAYGRSKLEAERCILERLKEYNSNKQSPFISPFTKGDKDSKQIYILRPAMIHGPGNKGNLNLLYKVVTSGIPWPLGAYDNQRSFASIDNVAFVIRQLIEKEIAPGTYQVADDETVSTNEIICLISDSTGKKSVIWKLPKGLIRSIAWLGGFIRLPLNSERLKKLTESYCVSNSKIKAALGIEKMPVSGTDGLMKTIASF